MRKVTVIGLGIISVAAFILPLGVDFMYVALMSVLDDSFMLANVYLYIVSAYLFVVGSSLVARGRIPIWGSPIVIVLATISFIAISIIFFRSV